MHGATIKIFLAGLMTASKQGQVILTLLGNCRAFILSKNYMFRAFPLPIISSFLLYIRHWYISCRFDDSFQAGSGHPDHAWRVFDKIKFRKFVRFVGFIKNKCTDKYNKLLSVFSQQIEKYSSVRSMLRQYLPSTPSG